MMSFEAFNFEWKYLNFHLKYISIIGRCDNEIFMCISGDLMLIIEIK